VICKRAAVLQGCARSTLFNASNWRVLAAHKPGPGALGAPAPRIPLGRADHRSHHSLITAALDAPTTVRILLACARMAGVALIPHCRRVQVGEV